MKKLDLLIDSLFYAVYFFFACLVCMFAEMLATRVVTLAIEISPFALCAMRAAIYTLGVGAILGIVAYKEGYKAAYAHPVSTILSVLIAAIPYSIFCLLFSFEPFCAGGVKYVTAMAKFGGNMTFTNLTDNITRLDPIGFFFVYIALYCGIMTLCKYLGAENRIEYRRSINTVEKDTENNQ